MSKRNVTIVVILSLLSIIGCSTDAKKGTALIEIGNKFYKAADLKEASDKNLPISQVKSVDQPEDVRGIRGAYGSTYSSSWDYYYNSSPYRNYYYSYSPNSYNPNNFCNGWGFGYNWCMINVYPNYYPNQWTNTGSSNCNYYGYNYSGNIYSQYPGCTGNNWWYY